MAAFLLDNKHALAEAIQNFLVVLEKTDSGCVLVATCHLNIVNQAHRTDLYDGRLKVPAQILIHGRPRIDVDVGSDHEEDVGRDGLSNNSVW